MTARHIRDNRYRSATRAGCSRMPGMGDRHQSPLPAMRRSSPDSEGYADQVRELTRLTIVINTINVLKPVTFPTRALNAAAGAAVDVAVGGVPGGIVGGVVVAVAVAVAVAVNAAIPAVSTECLQQTAEAAAAG